MLKEGAIIYVKIIEELSDHYKVTTFGRRYSGVLYFKDISDRENVGRKENKNIYFRVMVSRNRSSRNQYVFKQIPVIWKELTPRIKKIAAGKPLLCRVELVKHSECHLIILDKDLQSGDYHIEGILKKENAEKTLRQTLDNEKSEKKIDDISLHEVLWEGDLVYTCCIGVNHEKCYLELSLDKWLEKRETYTAHNALTMESSQLSSMENWEEEKRQMEKRASLIKEKIRRVLVLDDSERAGEVTKEFGKAVGIEVTTFTKSQDLIEDLHHNSDLYQAAIFDYNLSREDEVENGIKAALFVHNIVPKLPIVVVSAYLSKFDEFDDLSSRNIYGPFPRFGVGEFGLLNCLEIAAGIGAFHLPAEYLHAKQPNKNKGTEPLQSKLASIINENKRLWDCTDSFFIFGFSPVDRLIKCYYSKGKAIKSEQLQLIDHSIFLNMCDNQNELWVPDVKNHYMIKKAKSLYRILDFESLFGLPISVKSDKKFILICISNRKNFPDPVEKERLRHLASKLTYIIQYSIDTGLWTSRIRTYTLGSIIEGIAHDLNHKMRDLSESYNSYKLRYIDKKADSTPLAKISTSIEDILAETKTFTRQIQKLQRGSTGPELLSDILENINEIIGTFAAKKNTYIQIAKKVPGVFISGGEVRIVIFNILHNAIRYGKPTKHSVGIIELTFNVNNDILQIRISDKGVGIHHAYFSKVFDRGFSSHGGSGLGLSICYDIIESIGGEIKIENSILFGGTTFLIEIPVEKEDQ